VPLRGVHRGSGRYTGGMRIAARLLHPSSLLLIAANLLPLAGIFFWRWDTFLLLALYWMETAIIGFWTMLGLALAPFFAPRGATRTSPFIIVPFFLAHSGVFMGVHFLFLWSLFAGNWPKLVHGPQDFIDRIVIGEGLWIPLAAFFLSRGVSFFFSFFGPMLLPAWTFAARDAANAGDDPRSEASLMKRFYGRIVIMHLTILFGAAIASVVGNVGPLVLMVALKIAADLALHLKSDFPTAKPVVLTTV
jgi:hypothetical protein